MKQKLIYIAIAISLLCNVVFMVFFLMDRCSGNPSSSAESVIKNDPLSDPIQRQQQAEKIIRKLVCDQLYYPNTYDPVSTKVDSAFYCPIIDGKCVSAAYDILKMQEEYESAKSTYEQNDWEIRFHGNPSGPFLEHQRKARKESSEKMADLKKKIAEKEEIIRNRDKSHDGEFVGWWAVHKFRAANGNGQVSFTYRGYLLEKDMSNYILYHNLDDNDNGNMNNINQVIEAILKDAESNDE
jgi:hypothetical protein